MIEFEVFGGVKEFVNHRGPESIVHGPAETGKTIGALYKLHIAASTYPKASIVICRKVLSDTYSTVLQTFQNKVLPPKDELVKHGIQPYGGEKAEWFHYHKTDARIWMAGLDKSGKVLSSEHDLIYVNQAEQLSLDDWETLTTRTTGRAGNMPYSQTIGDMNPAYPSFWTYHRPSLKLFYSRHRENPALFNQATGEIAEQGKRTMAVLDALTGLRRTRLRDGKPALAEGAIYADWDESIHLVDEAPKCRRYIAAVDWGYTHPGVIGVFGIDNDGNMYLVAQVYHTAKQAEWWCERAVELNDEFTLWPEEHWKAPERLIEAWVCDPSEPAYIEQFRAIGLNAVTAFNRVRPGIDGVQTRLAHKGLYIVRDSLRYTDRMLSEAKRPRQVQDEFPGYVWSSRRKEQPVKEQDDGMDMLRYGVAYVDGLGRVQSRIVHDESIRVRVGY